MNRFNDERDEFSTLSIDDQFWIAITLDAMTILSGPDKVSNYRQLNELLGLFIILSKSRTDPLSFSAIFDRVYRSKLNYVSKEQDPNWNFGCGVFAALIESGCLLSQYGHIAEPKSFRFLMERLHGGRCRPYIPAAYVACLLHPDNAFDLNETLDQNLWAASVERLGQPFVLEPQFFPSFEDAMDNA